MVWLVPRWKEKYRMSEPHLPPAFHSILDKENKVKFRSDMGSLYHGISTAKGEACGWRDTWASQADGSC